MTPVKAPAETDVPATATTKRTRDDDCNLEKREAKRVKDEQKAIITKKIIEAVKKDDVEAIERIIQSDRINVSEVLIKRARFSGPKPLLHYAVEKRAIAVVDKLLQIGVQIDQEDGVKCQTALIYAITIGAADICKKLINGGANVNHKCKDGNTAIRTAVNRSSTDIVHLLLNSGPVNLYSEVDGQYIIELAANWGNLDIVKLIVGAHEDLHGALHAAVAGGHLDVLQYIIERTRESGDSVDIISDYALRSSGMPIRKSLGKTPLTAAIFYENIAAVTLLLDHGADPDQKIPGDGDSYTLLHICASNGYEDAEFDTVELVMLLIDAKSRVGALNRAGDTPLIIAARESNTEVARVLVGYGRADVEAELAKAIAANETRACKGFLAKLLIYNYAAMEKNASYS